MSDSDAERGQTLLTGGEARETAVDSESSGDADATSIGRRRSTIRIVVGCLLFVGVLLCLERVQAWLWAEAGRAQVYDRSKQASEEIQTPTTPAASSMDVTYGLLPKDQPRSEEDEALDLAQGPVGGPGLSFADFQRMVGATRYLDRDLELAESLDGRPPANLFDVANNAGDPRSKAATKAVSTVHGAKHGGYGKKFKHGHRDDHKPPHRCNMTDSEKCPFESMPRDEWTNVYPGGETVCIVGKPFFFQVLPGLSDRLFIYFQGGGSCWEEGSAKMRMCTFEPWYQPLQGVFDRNNTRNPYWNYTVVHIGYCSGDVHVADVMRNWTGPHGAPVTQRGYINALTAVSWAEDNFGNSTLDRLLIGGSSAGSLSAEVWARHILESFEYKTAALVLDSYAGVFPAGTQGGVISSGGVCGTRLLSEKMRARCNDGQFDVHDVLSETMETFPDVAVAYVNSKTDAVQIAFHDAIQISLLHDRHLISQEEFSKRLELIEEYQGRNPNFLIFDINSARHTYFTGPEVFNAEAQGVKLADWLAQFPVQEGRFAESKCDGKRGAGPTKTGWDYCSPTASDRTYTMPLYRPKRKRSRRNDIATPYTARSIPLYRPKRKQKDIATPDTARRILPLYRPKRRRR